MSVNESLEKSLYTAREPKKAITEEEANYLRIINLILRVAPQAVRVQFDKEFFPGGLQTVLNQNRFKVLDPLKRKRVINQKQWDLLYPRTGVVSSNNFDLTLMICLIRNLTEISVGDLLPLPLDVSVGADLSRMKHYRNLVAHCDDGTLSNDEFQDIWTEISLAVVRLGGMNFQKTCNELKVSTLDKNDMEILNEFRNIERSNNPISKGFQEVLDNIILSWKILDEKVIETSAIQHLMELATTADIITVIGSPGCGKSTAMYHLALEWHLHQDNDIIYSHDPIDLRNYYNPARKQIFIFDDVYGKYILEQPKKEAWCSLSTEINMILQNKTVKIFCSCRTHIYNQIEKDIDDIICRTVFNLLSDEHALTDDERILMAGKYLPEDVVASLMLTDHFNKYDFFPLLCKLSSNKSSLDIEKLYTSPVDFIRHDLYSMLKLNDQTTVATLFLFVIYNNYLTKELLCRRSQIRSILQDLSEDFKIPCFFSIKIVKEQLLFLKQSYVIEIDNSYKVIHDKIFDIMISFFGQYKFDLILEYAHSDVIRDRFQFESTGAPGNENMIVVSLEKEGDYLERLCTDIKNTNVENVFLNHQLQYQSFRTKCISWFEMNKADLAGPVAMHQKQEASPLLTMTCKGYSDMVQMLVNMELNVNVCDEFGRTPLIISSWMGDVDIVKILLDNKCNPNLCNKYRMSALYVASWMGFTPIVKLLLENKCKPNIAAHKIWNPLYVASELGNTDIVEILLQHRCTETLCNFDHSSPLYIALLKGNSNIAKMILRPTCCGTCDKYSSSTLSTVLHKFHEMIFKSIDDFFSDENSEDFVHYFRSGNILVDVLTLLSWHKWNDSSRDDILQEYKLSFLIAIAYGYENIVSLLLKKEVDAGYCFPDEKSPLILSYKNDNILKVLLDNNFHLNCKPHEQLLCKAASQGHKEKAKLLLQYNVNPNDCNNFGESPLHLATKYDNGDIVNILIQSNADPNICNKFGQTPLFNAVSYGNYSMVALLLSHGCNPNLCNAKNETPLYIATGKGNLEIVKLLLQYKCNPDVQFLEKQLSLRIFNVDRISDSEDPDLSVNIREVLMLDKYDASNPKELKGLGNSPNFTPLYIASNKGYTEIVRALLESKCNPDISNENSTTALFVAAVKGHTEIVRLLLDNGCNPHLCNSNYESPIYVASRYGYTEIVKLLLNHRLDHKFCKKQKTIPIRYTERFFTKSALYAASRKGHEDIIKLLLGYKSCKSENECPVYGMLIDRDIAMENTRKMSYGKKSKKIQNFISFYSANNRHFPVFSDVVPFSMRSCEVPFFDFPANRVQMQTKH